MKYLNDKITQFIKWCENEDVNIRIPSERAFYLYSKANNMQDELTQEEKEYLKVLATEKILLLAGIKEIPTDVAKYILAHDYNWDDKNKLDVKVALDKLNIVWPSNESESEEKK